MGIWQACKEAMKRWLAKLAESNKEQFGGVPPDCCRKESHVEGGKR